jgi:hypothetical protein
MLYNKNLDINYFESEYYKITIDKNIQNYKFYFYIMGNNLIIQRIDKNTGWDNHFTINIRNKVLHKNNILNINNNESNTKIITIDNNFYSLPTNHYEDQFIKIFYISDKYDDIYKIHYEKKKSQLIVERIDIDKKSPGWGQDLVLKLVEKNTPIYSAKSNQEIDPIKDSPKIKYINVGSSNKNIKKIALNIQIIKYQKIFNYYESDRFIINIYEINYDDKFIIQYYEDDGLIYIKRKDKKEGWGQDLYLNVYSKLEDINYIIYIGPSNNKILYKKINLSKMKCYVALSTIPSRIKLPMFLENIYSMVHNQTYPFEKLYITIAKKYKRFTDIIPDNIIDDLQKIPKVELIILDEDYGPASKYLGPLIYRYNEIKDHLLIIVDDDRFYNKNLLQHFVIGYNSFPEISYFSGYYKDYFAKNYKSFTDDYLEFLIYKEGNDDIFFHGNSLSGFYGFALHVTNMDAFIKYNFDIMKKLEKSIYHDEGIILGYLKYLEETILYIKHKGCNFIDNEPVDALCMSNLVNRNNIEKDILKLTNVEKLLEKN